MSLSNCAGCGRLMLQARVSYCEECSKAYEEHYWAIRRFLEARPGSNVLEIHRETGIAIPRILEIMKDRYTVRTAGSRQ